MKNIRIAIAAALWAALAGTPGAQGLSFGIKGGANVSRFTGGDVTRSDVRLAVVAGGFTTIGLGRGFAIQPELLFSMKGDKESEEVGGGTLTVITRLDYVECPLLLKFSFGNGIVPALFAGPMVSALTSATMEGRLGGFSATIDARKYFRPYDAGLVMGGEVKTERSSIEARYTVSHASIGEQVVIDGVVYTAPDMRNSTISLMFCWYII